MNRPKDRRAYGPSVLLLFLAALPASAQQPSGRGISLEDAIRMANPASETLELANASVYRARGEPYGMIVETDNGRAIALRVGYWENVQWIEGCS